MQPVQAPALATESGNSSCTFADVASQPATPNATPIPLRSAMSGSRPRRPFDSKQERRNEGLEMLVIQGTIQKNRDTSRKKKETLRGRKVLKDILK
jgi:hypothetical protein